MDYLKELYDMCEILSRELGEANQKIMQAGGKLAGADLEYVDKLTHALKSVKTTIAMMEAEEDGGSYYSGNMGGDYSRRYSREGGQGGSYGGSYRGSYARGRMNARRDSMGRYSGTGYSRDGGMVEELRTLMQEAPDDRTRQEFEQFIRKIESM